MGGDTLSMTAARLMPIRPDVARDVIIGSDILKDDMVRPVAKDLRPAFETLLGGIPYPNPAWKADLAQAAMAVYAAERGRNGALYSADDEDAMTASIERVIGKVATYNGGKVPLPPGMTEGHFSQIMFEMNLLDLMNEGGAIGRNGQALAVDDLQRAAKLLPLDIGNGRYAVQLPSGPVFNIMGKPLVINLRNLQKSIETRTGQEVVSDQNLLAQDNEDMYSIPGEAGYTRYRQSLGD
jgi:hypothetical protein